MLPPELSDLEEPGDPGLPDWLNPSALRGTLLSWGPAFLAPALWGFATVPEQLARANQISSRLFSLLSPVYDELAATPGYGEALELALLELRGSPGRILDVATGTGYAARRLKRQYPRAEVTGIDLSDRMVETARRDAEAEELDIDVQLGDASHLDFPADHFDLVVCQNAPPFCDELLRVLRPRGKALLVYSFGGPWVELAWKPLAGRLEKAGAHQVRGRRAGFGFFGLARKRG